MKQIKILIKNGTELCVNAGISLRELAVISRTYGAIAALVDNRLRELSDVLSDDCTVDFLDLSHQAGFRTYQRSAIFLLAYAVKSTLGPKSNIIIRHSINKNLYCTVNGRLLDGQEVTDIWAAMRKAVQDDLPVRRIVCTVEKAVSILDEFGNNALTPSLRFVRGDTVELHEMGGYYNRFYGPIVPSAGMLEEFRLIPENDGFILQLPKAGEPGTLQEVKRLTKISRVYEESAAWSAILNVDSVCALNEAVCGSRCGDIIRVNEALHEKRLASIADDIYNGGKNIILVAGPSSSGKTTFAKRLCVQLHVLGLVPHIISLDNYFLGRDFVPKDEFGEPDFESIDFVDIEQLNIDLRSLLDGSRVEIPVYNFITGEREYKGNYIQLSGNDVIVIEGIHGLNEALTDSIPKSSKYKVFISALNQINIDRLNRIPTSDARLIRRIVRDMRSRGYDAAKTLSIWDSVARGEERNIFPFQEDADSVFNSSLVYELSVLKQYAEPLLFGISHRHSKFADARRLLSYLDSFVAISPDDVPNNSIIREFIGGSCFDV